MLTMTAPRLSRSEVGANAAADANWRLGYEAGLREVRLRVVLFSALGAFGAWLISRRSPFVAATVFAGLAMLVLVAVHYWPVVLAALVLLVGVQVIRRRHVRSALSTRLEPF